jgi:hypothetical protein
MAESKRPESPWAKSDARSILDEIRRVTGTEDIHDLMKRKPEDIEAAAKITPVKWPTKDRPFIARMKEIDDEIESMLDFLTPAQRATYFSEKMGQHLAGEMEDFDQGVSAITVFSAHALQVIQIFLEGRLTRHILEALIERIKKKEPKK